MTETIKDLETELDELQRDCNYDGCTNPQKSRGLCTGHYWQLIRRRSLSPLRKKVKAFSNDTCIIVGCDKPFYAREVCKLHYKKMNKILNKEREKAKLKGAEWNEIETDA